MFPPSLGQVPSFCTTVAVPEIGHTAPGLISAGGVVHSHRAWKLPRVLTPLMSAVHHHLISAKPGEQETTSTPKPGLDWLGYEPTAVLLLSGVVVVSVKAPETAPPTSTAVPESPLPPSVACALPLSNQPNTQAIPRPFESDVYAQVEGSESTTE